MQSCMLAEGGNNFKETRMKKEQRRRVGINLEVFNCNEEAFKIATDKLEQS